MTLVVVDKNRKRSKELRGLLERASFGQGLESFASADKAIEWCSKNSCRLLLVDQHLAEDQKHTAQFIRLSKKIPILILKNVMDENVSFDEIPLINFFGPKVNPEKLLESAQHLIALAGERGDMGEDDSQSRYALAINAANDGVWDWDLETQQIYYSKRWLDIIGYNDNFEANSPVIWFSRVHPDDVTLLDTAIDSHLRGTSERLVCEYRIRHRNGFYRWVLTRGKAVFNAQGKPVRLVGSQTDMNDRKVAEDQLAHDALHDPLTGLANRSLLMERLNQMLLHQRRDPSHLVSVLFIDLDKFKDINDNLGHEAGDEILKNVALRLHACSRENDTIARIGGDEFVMLASGLTAEKDADILASRIIAEISKPNLIGDEVVHVGASIGVLLDTTLYEDPERALRDADLALYHAKTNGRHRYDIYSENMQINKSQHFALQSTLSGALDRHELIMHYQPILNMKTSRLAGFEALMRWRHPENGFIYPLDFIPVAEETGLINELGAWGLNAACTQLVEFKRQFSGSEDWFMAVNVSGRQLQTASFQRLADDVLSNLELNPQCVLLELTEGALMHNVDAIAPHIHALKELGVNLAIDDFGTGFSSLSVINDFPIDVLKIPREFIMDIHLKPKNLKTVKLIELLAQESNMRTVVEGVEKNEEYEVLKKTKCDMVQGYLFSKAISPLDLIQDLKSNTQDTFVSEEKKEEVGISKIVM